MQERAAVLTSWQENDTGSSFALLTAHPLPPGASVMDVTGQPAVNLLPDPNALVVEVWADTEYLDEIESSDPGSVLWCEAIEDGQGA